MDAGVSFSGYTRAHGSKDFKMRIELIQAYTFSGVANNGAVTGVLPIKPYERLAVAINTTALTGAPTNFNYHFVPIEKNTSAQLFDPNSMQSENQNAVGVEFIDMSKTNPVTPMAFGPIFFNVFEEAIIILTFTGGTAPTASGSVYVFGSHP